MYEDIFESIRNEAEKRNLRERTIQLYCSNVSSFLRCTGKKLSVLTLEDADSFLTQKRLEGRSPETHNHYRSAIKFFYKRVLRMHWDDDDIPAMKRERTLPTVLTHQEIHSIIDATRNLKHKAIIATMYSSGLRVSEVIHLHYDDISRRVSSHACRHSFASHLFESGTDIKYIQSLLGHVDPRSTDVYLHVSNKTLLGIRSPFDSLEGGGA